MNPRIIAWAVGIAALIALPFVYRDPYHLHILVLILIWSFAYTSWSIMGRFGLVSLGHGGFMGVGAYVTALLWNHLGVSPWIGIPVGMAAAGVLALIVEPEDVAEREYREVRAQGQSPEQLLFNWITECLYVHEIEGFVVCRVDVDACSATVVHGVLHGEELDTGRHRLGTSVKAATMAHLSVVERDGRHELRIGVKG